MENILDEDTRVKLKEMFVELDKPVGILFFGSKSQSCDYCGETKQLLEEVASLSDKIIIHNYDLDKDTDVVQKFEIDKVPVFVLAGQEGDQFIDYGIRFAGIPAGHEFVSLINGLLMVSKRDSGLGKETREYLAKLKKPLYLQVFVTPTCPYCPRAVVLAHQLAFESPMVKAEMVEATEFEELSTKYGIMSVPDTVINQGAGRVVGAVPESVMMERIQEIVG